MENRRKRRQKGKKPANSQAAMNMQNTQNAQYQYNTYNGQNAQGMQNEDKQERKHIVFDDLVVPQVMEPRPNCVLCGQPIEAFAEAISEPNGGYSHFDCVLEKLRAQENVQAPDTISYIGHGTFAVVSKDAEGKYFIKTRIPYESNEAFADMKKQVEAAKQ